MKIVFATDNYFPSVGGIEIATRRLASGLSKAGNKVYIIAPSKTLRNETYREGSLTIFGVRSLLTPVHKYLRYSPPFLVRGEIFEILRRVQPDVIHIQTNVGIAVCVSEFARRFRVPTVATNHFMTEDFVYSLKLPMFLRKFIEKESWILSRPIWEHADILTAPTKMAAEYFRRKSGIKKEVVAISNGVDMTRFKPGKKKDHKIPNIVVVGRLDPAKKVDIIIRAMPEILKTKRVNLFIIGRGSETEKLKKLVKDLGIERRVFFKGFSPEGVVVKFYQNADILVTASVIETQGVAVLEAVSCGLPVVAVNAGALPEIVEDGKNGFLFPPENSLAVAKAVLKIVSDKKLRQRMSVNSLKMARRHKINGIVNKLSEVYKKAMGVN